MYPLDAIFVTATIVLTILVLGGKLRNKLRDKAPAEDETPLP